MTILFNIILYHIILFYFILYYIILYYIILYIHVYYGFSAIGAGMFVCFFSALTIPIPYTI